MSFNYNADPSKKKQKIVLKYIFAYKSSSSKKTMTQLAFLTDDDRYIEYELSFQKKDITKYVAKRIRSLFNLYEVNSKTEVVFNREYDVDSPLYMYMMFLQQHLRFNLRTVTTEVILRGIVAYHQSYLKVHGLEVTKNYANKLWSKVVENNACSWITQKYDEYLSTLSAYKRRDKKILRLGVYYIVLKNYRDSIWRRGYQKKIQNQHSFDCNSDVSLTQSKI